MRGTLYDKYYGRWVGGGKCCRGTKLKREGKNEKLKLHQTRGKFLWGYELYAAAPMYAEEKKTKYKMCHFLEGGGG